MWWIFLIIAAIVLGILALKVAGRILKIVLIVGCVVLVLGFVMSFIGGGVDTILKFLQ